MNISQARQKLKAIKKVLPRKCGICGQKWAFSLVEESMDGWHRDYVRVTCKCGNRDFKEWK